MSNYLTEEEQFQQLKDWWKKYGNKLLVGIIIIVLLFIGWRWLQERQQVILDNASDAYEVLLEQVANENPIGIEVQNDYIRSHYPKTTYAQLSALLYARQLVYSGEYESAHDELRWVVEEASNPRIKQIARLRLARLLQNSGELKQALGVLQVVDADNFTSAVAELRGDIYLQQGEMVQARQAYLEAVESLEVATVTNPLLEMKLHSLPESSSQITEESSANEIADYV